LDAAESVYPATPPVIGIEFTETENGLMLSVADNGPGIPAEEIPHIADFIANSGTKLFYRAPLRGAQGNAIKTLIGMPVALGQEHGHLEIETQGQRHTLKAWLTVTGPKKEHQQTAIDSPGTRITVMIPGPVECFYWEPARWITAYSLFNPHAQLQIRKIAPVWSEISEKSEGQQAVQQFSDLSLTPTVGFPDPWRKFLPTDHTPAHWYSATEFRHLLYAKADRDPSQPLGDFIQEFKGLSRVWRKVIQAIPVKTLGELLTAPDMINALHSAMQEHATAPKPEILGHVGKDHFRQRFDEQFLIAQDAKGNDRYWYKHQFGHLDGMPYQIEVAIAETERPGGVFYGLNYSVPFSDPLSTTHLSL
jgi:DNA topoisomerase VI subunit B